MNAPMERVLQKATSLPVACCLSTVDCRLLARLWILALAVLALGGRAQEGLIEEDDDEKQAVVEGAVTLSSGECLRGMLSFTEGKELRVYDVHARRSYSLGISRIDSIRTLVEEETMEEAWAFEEGGSRKKIQLGWKYPLRKYRQEVQLVGGQMIEGHCHAAVVYVRIGGEEKKVILPRAQKGERGQKLEDLVHPTNILFGPPGPKTVTATEKPQPLGSIEGKIAGISVIAVVDRSSGKGYPGTVKSDGSFRVAGLLAGEYTVFLRTRGEITLGFGPKSALSAQDMASIQSRIDGLAEFFDSKRVLAVTGEVAAPWVFLELERKKDTTLEGEGGGSYHFRRWELWRLRRQGGEWHVESRVFLDREVLPPGKAFQSLGLRLEPRLERVSVKAGGNSLPPVKS